MHYPEGHKELLSWGTSQKEGSLLWLTHRNSLTHQLLMTRRTFDPTTCKKKVGKPVNYYFRREKRSVAVGWEAVEVEEQQKEQFRRPRDILLCLTAQFLEMAVPRLKDLTKLSMGAEHVKIPEVMDHKCHVKLGEVALTLLKIAPYDLATTSCQGLQKYFLTILPLTDWSIESNRSALNIILRRLDKTIAKVYSSLNWI